MTTADPPLPPATKKLSRVSCRGGGERGAVQQETGKNLFESTKGGLKEGQKDQTVSAHVAGQRTGVHRQDPVSVPVRDWLMDPLIPVLSIRAPTPDSH